jgi:hypothetical protein
LHVSFEQRPKEAVHQTVVGHAQGMTPEQTLRAFYKPYGPDLNLMPYWMRTWNSDQPIFRESIERTRPRRIIEVGSWMGGSAIHMANICAELGLKTSIICVDTWLGDFNATLDGEFIANPCRGGYPSAYFQFASNIVHLGLQDIITPFPQSSYLAAKRLVKLKAEAELIYIDACHEEEAVYADLTGFWPLLKDGGEMFGDDWPHAWGTPPDSVANAVNQFSMTVNRPVKVIKPHWLIKK